jgi:beta-lactam-binding protein with PASTA domain
VIAGFALFRLAAAGSRPAATPGPQSVVLPSFIGSAYTDAYAKADQLGIVLTPTYVKQNDAADGTVVGQNPPAGTSVVQGSTVNVNVVSGKDLVTVPSIIGLAEADAIRALVNANLQLGARTLDFDPTIPAGSIISQGLPAGLSVPTDTPVDYVVSQGPEPSPSPSPSPSPPPLPSPSPSPEPSVTPSGGLPSPPAPVTVLPYAGLGVEDASAQAAFQGLVIQWEGSGPAPSDVVVAQNPPPGTEVAPRSTIFLTTAAPAPSPSL